MQQPPLLHFKVEKISEISLLDYESLKECISLYKSCGDEGSEDQIANQIDSDLKFGVWFAYDSGKIVGFLASKLIEDQYQNRKCVVDYIYMKTGYDSKVLAQTGIDWVKSIGIKEIIFSTRRNPLAMAKILPGEWKVDSTVLSLCV